VADNIAKAHGKGNIKDDIAKIEDENDKIVEYQKVIFDKQKEHAEAHQYDPDEPTRSIIKPKPKKVYKDKFGNTYQKTYSKRD